VEVNLICVLAIQKPVFQRHVRNLSDEEKKIWTPIASFCIILGLLSNRILIEGLTDYFLKHMNPAIAKTFTPPKILQYVVFAVPYRRTCLNSWFPSYAVLLASCILQGLNE